MSDHFRLIDVQMARLEPFFPKSHKKPRVDDERVLSGVMSRGHGGRMCWVRMKHGDLVWVFFWDRLMKTQLTAGGVCAYQDKVVV